MDLQADLAKTKESIHHHRIVILAIVAFLILLTIAVNTLLRSTLSSKFPPTPAAQSQPKQETTIPLTSEYINPFDKNTQYVNPFSQYKNPFDTLK